MSTEALAGCFEYRQSPDQSAPGPVLHPVVVVGAGPVGLACAIDLAQQGVPVVVLDEDAALSSGSRAICFAKRTLEIFDRLGCGEPIADKGVGWNVGKVFLRDELIYTFNLLAEPGHARPAFVNLQQYYVERFLVERAVRMEKLEIRWRNHVTSLRQLGDARDGMVELGIETPDGPYVLQARYVIAADGSRSTLRRLLGLEHKGREFKDRFLIADVKMKADFPAERWFWFDPPFHRNQSVLLHRQPDNVWRIDFQLGWDADPEAEKQPERVMPRVRALLGPDAKFELEWVSVYTFSCRRIERFRHARVLFVGDAAHGVSPFGARGANSGVQDAENLAWKLRLVIDGLAPEALLDTYASERERAADENILNSTRSTDFITPKSEASRMFRDAALQLSRDCPFARRLVNSGRLSVPTTNDDSPLNTPDPSDATFRGTLIPGAPCSDAPVRVAGANAWFLRQIGDSFTGLLFQGEQLPDAHVLDELCALEANSAIPFVPLIVVPRGATLAGERIRVIEDVDGLLRERYDAASGTFYLLRPDQHVCARWRRFDAAAARRALDVATCRAVAPQLAASPS